MYVFNVQGSYSYTLYQANGNEKVHCPIYGGVQYTGNRGLKQLTVYRCLLVTEASFKDVLWIRLGSVSALLYPYPSGSFTMGIRYDKYVNILITIKYFVKKNELKVVYLDGFNCISSKSLQILLKLIMI